MVELRVWPGQMHVFQIAAPMVPEATRSLRQIGEYIREATDRITTPPVIEDYADEEERDIIPPHPSMQISDQELEQPGNRMQSRIEELRDSKAERRYVQARAALIRAL